LTGVGTAVGWLPEGTLKCFNGIHRNPKLFRSGIELNNLRSSALTLQRLLLLVVACLISASAPRDTSTTQYDASMRSHCQQTLKASMHAVRCHGAALSGNKTGHQSPMPQV
jgi:hypothetical protein